MSIDIKSFLETQRRLLTEEKRRLGLLKDIQAQYHEDKSELDSSAKETPPCPTENKENSPPVTSCELSSRDCLSQKLPLVERLDLYSNEGNLDKQAFIDTLVNSENPLSFRTNEGNSSQMLRCGEYSPNNPQFRVAAAPYLGLGEYEQRKKFYSNQRKVDYLQHLSKRNEQVKNCANSIFLDSKPVSAYVCKAVQTDIQNIHNRLVQYELHSNDPAEKELSPQVVIDGLHTSKTTPRSCDQNLLSSQNAFLRSPIMDKPKSILSKRNVSRDRMVTDYNSYGPSFLDGFSYQEKSEQLEKERLKREVYQAELRQQIEEKRRLAAMREDQERRQQELENRRLEQQLLRMQEEEVLEQQKSKRDEQFRRNSEDYTRRRQELPSRLSYRKHLNSESSLTNLRNTNVASKSLAHYSPPVSRRNPYSYSYTVPSTSAFSDPSSRYSRRLEAAYGRRDALSRLDSLSAYDSNSTPYNSFSRYDSLSRIDSLKRQDSLSRHLETLSISDGYTGVQRRHSGTQQDLSLFRRSPKLQRRSSSSRMDDPLPIPVLKARSPVAKELKNSVAVNSSRSSSDAVRRLEDKWQVPAVQRNILNRSESLHDGSNRSVLTQLGAIRMQLQQEQLRMDETLRRRGITQSKAVDFH